MPSSKTVKYGDLKKGMVGRIESDLYRGDLVVEEDSEVYNFEEVRGAFVRFVGLSFIADADLLFTLSEKKESENAK